MCFVQSGVGYLVGETGVSGQTPQKKLICKHLVMLVFFTSERW